MAEWESFTWNGDPLKSTIQGIASAASAIIGTIADLLDFLATILEIIAALIIDFTDPLAAITSALQNLIQNFLEMLFGDFYILVVGPLSANDTFGPTGFTRRVAGSFDDLYDYMRPQFGASDLVCGISFYFNFSTLQEIASAIQGLGILFGGAVTEFENFANSVENYVPYEQLTEAQLTQRTYGRPPDWFNGTVFATVTIMEQLYGPLKQMAELIAPASAAGDFLNNYAQAIRGLADQLTYIADQLDYIVSLLNSSLFTAARLHVPLAVGGNDYLKASFQTAQQSLIDSGSFSEDYYSFGIVVVSDADGCPMLEMLGGI